MEVQLNLKKIVRFLLILLAVVSILNLAVQLSENYLEHSNGRYLFDLNIEQSILRFFSTVLLLLCSELLLTIALVKKKNKTNSFLFWLGLALIFFLLATAKETSLQENLAIPIRSLLHLSKIQFYTIAYGIVLVIIPLVYLKFLLSLPRKTIVLLVLGGFIFIAGAFGLDLLGAWLENSTNTRDWILIVLSTMEDTFEMGGIIIIIYALLSYISSELKWLGVRITE